MQVIENIRRVVTCGAGGPLVGPAMRELAVLAGDLCVAVRDGRVAYVGPRAGLPAGFAGAARIDADGRVLTPGLIDCHTHPAFVKARAEEFELRMAGASYEQIAARGGGILTSMTAVRQADDATLLAQTVRNLRRLRNHGVVVAEGKSGYGLNTKDERRQLAAIRDAGEHADMHTVRTCLAAHSLPAEYRGGDEKRAEYLRLVMEQILPAAVQGGLAQRADVFCERGVFTPAETRAVAQAASRLGLHVTIHAEQLHLTGGATIAASVGAHSADHLEYLDDAGAKAMRDAGTAAVLLPGSTYALKMDKWADGRKLIDMGLCVALATDFNPGSSPVCNPAFVMNLAVMHCGLTPAEALAGFTANAAHALRLPPGEYGVVAPGARAAFGLWDVDDEREIAYYAGSNLCEVITCDGWRS